MTIRPAALLLTALLLCSVHPVFCQPKPLTLRLSYATTRDGLKIAVLPKKTRPKLGLALAGGGAKAAASIGVLKVLVREGIPVDAIAGTSMGADVGGFFAAGYSPDEIERIFLGNDWNDIFTDTPPRAFLTQEQKEAGSHHLLDFTFYRGRFLPPSGLSAGQKVTRLFMAKTLAASFEADLDFDKLKVPFRAVATDLETGGTVAIDHGMLHDAMRASTALPVVFQPIELQGRLLVDGGLSNNLPVDVVRTMGVNVVIAVDPSKKLEKKDQLTTLLDIMSQSISLEVQRESRQQAARADLVITPDTADFAFTDFPFMAEIIKKGEDAAQAVLPKIRELLRPAAADRAGTERFRITSLVVRGNVNVPEATIRYAMAPVLFPREATREETLAALGGVYELGYFSDAALDLEKEGDGTAAVLWVEENPVVKVIEVSGNTLLTTDEILSSLAWQKGQVLNTTRLSATLDALAASCRDRGFLLTRVERVEMRADSGTLGISLYEGRVDSVTLEGQKKTRQSLILRETQTRPGRPLNFTTTAYDIQHLYALEYFESLSLDMTKSAQGGIDLTFRIKEKPTTRLRLGLRYDLDDRFTGLTDIVVDNVTGRGIKFFLNTRYGNYTDITTGYRSPVFLDAYFVHSVQAFYRERSYFIYEDKHTVNEFHIKRTGVDFAFGYQWFRFGDTYLRYRYATDSMDETRALDPAQDIVHIGSLAFLTTVDTRDRSVFPHSGLLFKGSYETARREYGSSNAFTRAAAYLEGDIPLAERHTVVLEGSVGIGSGIFPYQERFGIGGIDHLLGYPLAGYQRREFTGPDELGFSASYRWRMKEYHLKAIRAVYLNLAGQAANVWDDRAAMSVDHLRTGGSIGLHADSIIGPMRLDLGAGAQRRYTVYFSAGFEF